MIYEHSSQSLYTDERELIKQFSCPLDKLWSHLSLTDNDFLRFCGSCTKEVVDITSVLATHHKPIPGNRGPSCLTTLGHTKDSLWSVDLFRCESILLKSHWVMVVMDQYTRRIIGFAGQAD